MITKRMGEWLEISVPRSWNGFTIENLLKTLHAPKAFVHQLRMEKGLKINDKVLPWHKELVEEDKLLIHLFRKEELGVSPSPINIDVLYEDEHVLVVNKPAPMDTHPGHNDQKDTLANAVANYYSINGIETKVRHIHRLDRDTTGAILFAKDRLSAAILDRMLTNREIKRTYVALVRGKISPIKGVINKPIGKDRHHSSKRRISPTGQHALTEYELIHFDKQRNCSLIQLRLLTGRTHQIRVHMNYIGFPLLGDKLYNDQLDRFPRQALHAKQIEFSHPITNVPIICNAPFIDTPPIFRDL